MEKELVVEKVELKIEDLGIEIVEESTTFDQYTLGCTNGGPGCCCCCC